MYTIAIGCDPNAQEVKAFIISSLEKKGYSVKDFGSTDPIYANVAIQVAEAVAQKEYDRGILICGTGIGVCLAANKVKGAYAALISDVYSAERAQKSNNANIACFGAFTLGNRLMEKLIDVFLSSEYTPGGPSQKKIDRIYAYESRNNL
ncbi:RpiB/LacA/LacB family sugar-phosphate isomerase [Christensenella intestinihominis]|uniref:RpiB/LacA/LacB family sugar-phosphate isomerase n=1 Tax=Christensenella intestinihominis TaxID=1851429 RepID=UPI00082DA64B|nr:RpiB/LacA/LacB family sugar-phosphate isomerase [Christensenella intestinihominis]